MEFLIKRTTANNEDFQLLVKKLDHELWVELEEDQATYDQYNTVLDIQTAVVIYRNNEPVACGCFKQFDKATVAGCMVVEGKIARNNRVRLVRDGIIIHNGELGSLKRFKDDVKEVNNNMECGLTLRNYNDLKVGDMVEAFEEIEIKRTL